MVAVDRAGNPDVVMVTTGVGVNKLIALGVENVPTLVEYV